MELEPIIKTGSYPVWVGGEVLSDSELKTLRLIGVDITNFSNSIVPKDNEAINDALATIAEHHPGERVWLEINP